VKINRKWEQRAGELIKAISNRCLSTGEKRERETGQLERGEFRTYYLTVASGDNEKQNGIRPAPNKSEGRIGGGLGTYGEDTLVGYERRVF